MNGRHPGIHEAVRLADDVRPPRRRAVRPRGGRARVLLEALLLLAAFVAFMAAIQFATYSLPDNDGYYHIRMAALMREQGLTPEFPWLPLTILNPREYADHHLLYHVALMPFSLLDLRLGAKWSAVVLASFAFLAVWWLLRGQGVRHAHLWAVGLLATSDAFLFRMSVTRAQSLSLAMLALGMHWLLRGAPDAWRRWPFCSCGPTTASPCSPCWASAMRWRCGSWSAGFTGARWPLSQRAPRWGSS